MKKILFFSLLFNFVLNASSQTGLDPNFATGGIGIYSPMPQSQAQAIAVQADGKILVGGIGSAFPQAGPIIRLNPDGTLDASFNGTGSLQTTITIESIAIQPDGKILLGGIGFQEGTSYNVFTAIRLNPNGTYDNSFGTNGIVYVDIVFGVDYGQAIALQPDGKIVLAGNSQIPGTDFDISVVRLMPDGSLDNSFDGDGKYVIERFGTTEYESGLVVQPDGKILVEGKTYLGPDPDLMVVRLNSGGGLDNSFGINGVFTFEEIDGYEPYFGKTLALQPDGKILVGRNSYVGDNITKFIALRINPNGTPDNSFDNDGYATVAFGGGEEICTAIALQADGKIVLSGYSVGPIPNRADFALARLNTDGSLDHCFNQTGKLVIPRTDWDEAVDMTLQADGKILIAGYTYSTASSFIVMRIQSTGGAGVDADGDGYSSCVDCNDNNATIHPGATEICNSLDDDCDGQIDEGLLTIFYRDADVDGYGDPALTIEACALPAGYVVNNADCNDNNAAIHPGATETCNSVDDDCDGLIDEDVQSTFFRDFDSDGYGNPSNSTQACTLPAGFVANNTDCNDNDPTIHPGAPENTCNGVDNDCDGQVDEDTQMSIYFFDGDNDGWGVASQTIQACAFPPGYAVNPGDCNDSNPGIHPGATELCNGIDEDCDGQIDDGAVQTYFQDNDGDGYGNNTETAQGCSPPPGYVINGNDCNDNNASINPGAEELCNGIDDDCDGLTDDGLTLNTYYRDFDGDGYGVMITIQACVLPQGYANQPGDCNENDPNIHPGAAEICNTIDDDCDGQVDEGLTTNWYRDNDGDGYGNANALLAVCFQPAGYVADNTDCVDTDPAIHPGAAEICNEKDDDCDGLIDEGFAKNTYYKDADGDGYGDPNSSVQACTLPFGYVADNSDCDDANDTIYPNAAEYCNGIDENCNGIIDDNPVLVTWYRDADQDGWGNPNQTVQACTPPPGFIREEFDCNDSDPAVHPGATEICNGIDDDCNIETEETCSIDNDGDGYTVAQGDCDDNDPAIHPGATEICNMKDDDCDGQTDEDAQSTYYLDFDGDGYGNPSLSVQGCTAPAGYVTNNIDCNDSNAAVHPGALEYCGNGVDDNCNGVVDENTSAAAISPAGEVILCTGTEVVLSANTGPGLSYQWFRNNNLLTGETAATITVNSAGNYSVSVTNSGNCVATSLATVVVSVNTPKAGISIQGGGNNCPVNLQAHPGGPVSYQWNRNNVPIAGATQRSYSATTSGSYTVTVTKDDCPGTSLPVNVTSCSQNRIREYTKTREESLPVPDKFNIYPNPAIEYFMVDLILDEETSGDVTIQVTTVAGNVLSSQKILMVKGRILQRMRLNPGWRDNIYIVKVITGQQIFTEKLFVLRF